MDCRSRNNLQMSSEINGFKMFALRKELELGIKTCGLELPSKVQQECIPKACSGLDVLCQAMSGTGRTLIYITAILNQIPLETEDVEALVLCPTRELAQQVGEQFKRVAEFLPDITIESFFGGLPVSRDEQILLENPPQIVVGTPGRILQLVKKKALKLENVKQFIIDECDEIFQFLSMRSTVQEIFVSTPQDKQVMMFSATIPSDVKMICKKFMQKPFDYIRQDNEISLKGLNQSYVCTEYSKRIKTLLTFIEGLKFNQAIVFVSNSKRCDVLAHVLQKLKHSVVSIHNGLLQMERMSCFKEFMDGEKQILITTNLFSRGISDPRINLVINYDTPNTPINYLHRASRVMALDGRGMVLTFLCGEKDANILTNVQEQFDVTISKIEEQDIVSKQKPEDRNEYTKTKGIPNFENQEKLRAIQWAEDAMNRLCDDFENTSFV